MDALKKTGQMLDQINLEQIPRSGFDLSFNNKATGKIGRIIPTRCMETLPGDSIKGNSQASIQFEPLAVPILSNMHVRQETWYVPNHILFDNWDTLISKGENLQDNSSVPSVNLFQIFRAFFASDGGLLGNCFTNPIKFYIAPFFKVKDSDTMSQAHSLFVDFNSLIDFCQKLIAAIGTDDDTAGYFQVDDLLYYRKQVLSDFMEYIYDYNSIYGVDIYDSQTSTERIGRGLDFYVDLSYFSNNAYESGQIDKDYFASHLPLAFNELAHGKYLSLMSSYDKDLYDILYRSDSDSTNYYVFNSFGNKFVQFIYDFISPVLGSSSLLEYLGYETFSLLDIYYILHQVFTTYIVAKLNVATSHSSLDTTYGSFFINLFSGFVSTTSLSVLPLRAYYAIWYNNYRDKLLETKTLEPATGSIVTNEEIRIICLLRVRCWQKDIFNTSLANTGTGNMVVPISQALSGTRKILTGFEDKSSESMLDLNLSSYKLADGTEIQLPTRYLSPDHLQKTMTNQLKYEFSLDTLRRAGRTEKWIQKALIYGNLIQDSLFTHWGVKIKNERIQLPEFVSSSSQIVQINTLVNNTTTNESIAGDKSAIASAYDNGNGFDFYSPENGFLLSFITILPEQSYAYGVPRHLSKLKIFDYAFPEFAQIGMDAVYNSEIKSIGSSAATDFVHGVFGYQGRYYDYKSKQDEEHGELRNTESMYTFSRDFNMYSELSRPKLNYIFVHCWPSLDMFVVDDVNADYFRFDVHHSVAASRALPVCGLSV